MCSGFFETPEALNPQHPINSTEYVDLATAGGANVQDAFVCYEPEYDQHRRITRIGNRIRSRTYETDSTRIVPVAVYDYTYDAAGNRQTEDFVYDTTRSLTAAGFSKGRDVDYAYDRLHRVTGADYDSNVWVSLVIWKQHMKSADGYDKHRIIGEWRAIARPTGCWAIATRSGTP